MAKKNPFDLSTDARGNYKRSLGVKLADDGSYTPQVFYFGRVYQKACERVVMLEKAWNAVHDRWYRFRDGPRAAWDSTTMEVAKAICRGDEEVALPYPYQFDPETVAVEVRQWLLDLQTTFPMVRVVVADRRLSAVVDSILSSEAKVERLQGEAHAAKARAHELRATATEMLRTGQRPESSSGQTIGEALEGYKGHLRTHYRGVDGLLTEYGGGAIRRVDNLITHLGEKAKLPLSKLNTSFIKEWLAYWSQRPKGKRGKPVSRNWAKEVLKSIREFVRWLHESSDFQWSRPTDYEVRPVRIAKTLEEKATIKRTPRYRREQVKTLWEYATPRDRVCLLLGLNCGFGKGEIATLRLDEVKLDKALIRRKRTKTEVFCKWRLWPETVEALKWYLEHARPESSSPYVFLTKQGTAYVELTSGGRNRSQHVNNYWDRVFARIRKDQPDFPKLSFNKLRKTGASFVRRKYGAEVADLYLSHGEQGMVDNYSDPRFAEMAKATDRMRKWLGDCFSGVSVPFPDDDKPSARPVISRATIRRIVELRKLHTVNKVAEMLGVGRTTVVQYQHATL